MRKSFQTTKKAVIAAARSNWGNNLFRALIYTYGSTKKCLTKGIHVYTSENDVYDDGRGARGKRSASLGTSGHVSTRDLVADSELCILKLATTMRFQDTV